MFDSFNDLFCNQFTYQLKYSPKQVEQTCFACDQLAKWSELIKTEEKKGKEIEKDSKKELKYECPLSKEELGHSTWNFLHTVAAFYPENPSEKDKEYAYALINSIAHLYPCVYCSNHLKNYIENNPLDLRSSKTFSLWLCRLHNSVNKFLKKPLFNCSKVLERWKYGSKECQKATKLNLN
ncbi:fad-linked sulfhydryl oxidase alr [Anaeramoeba ignava]|uniref:Sulfhydryl oxidase n=1 Tax=Anaeramoeba ignava TaxID=1746090 RepID=A0A9Q0R8I3_ANAIG|nr:fad-linked sulfhydryl oxidase alr [Anaeramoeba ignava]